MTLERGVLVVTPGKRGAAPTIRVRDKGTVFSPRQGEVSQSILDQLKDFNGKEVEFERVRGQPEQIREVGGRFIPPGMGRREAQQGGQWRDARGDQGAQRGEGQRRDPRRDARPDERQPGPRLGNQSNPIQSGKLARRADFHNPYNFIPAPPRKLGDPDLGDHGPVPQDEFAADRYTGWIRVRMVAETPLLVPDTENVRESDQHHKTFGLRLGADGKPLIPASGVRGMLRSAYEAVTNSRFGRFSYAQHRVRLAFRMDAHDGLKLIPARVENGQIRLLTGTSNVGSDGGPVGPIYATWLPRYQNGQTHDHTVKYPTNSLPQHGDEVVCWVECFQHHRWDNKRNQHVQDFKYWKVRKIVRAGHLLGAAPPASTAGPKRDRQSWHEPLGQPMRQAQGWVCVTNANINRKHDERVFFVDAAARVPGPFPMTDVESAKWRELVCNYQSIHKEQVRKRREDGQQPDAYLGPEPGQTAWSRHVYTPGEDELRDGTLCYVRLNASKTGVDALFPVMIARELYPVSPWTLLHASLRPAETLDQISPADRVFGWVRVDTDQRAKKQPVAVRGLLRVGPVRCESSGAESVAEAVEPFSGDGVPLAILSTPKPQQGRFYVAKSTQGEAQSNALSKVQAGYTSDKGLRGRKVYPHHKNLPSGYWDNPMQDRTQQAAGNPPHYQEYRRPLKNNQEQRDDQNRSVRGWVKPGTKFTFDLHVHNLSKVELGALLWLLTLPEGHFFRFGGGRPLGFGSVRLSIDSCDLRTGAELGARYAAWLDTSAADDPRGDAIQAFKDALRHAYGSEPPTNFDDIRFIKAFLVACRGFDDGLPIHYPRASQNGQDVPPAPEGESFRWFVANERQEQRYALPDVWIDRGLPALP